MKRLPILLILLSMALLLCGCADSDLNVTVNENGGIVAYKYYVDKCIVDEYFSSELPEGLKTCEIDEIDGRICYVYSESFTAQSFTELEDKLCNITLYGEDGMNFFSSASINEESLKLTVNAFISEDIKGVALAQGAELEDLSKLTLTITMLREIKQYSEGTLSEDRKTLTLELCRFDKEKTIEIMCKAKETRTDTPKAQAQIPKLPLIIGVVIILVGAISVSIVFLIKRRNRKLAEAMPDTPIDKI